MLAASLPPVVSSRAAECAPFDLAIGFSHRRGAARRPRPGRRAGAASPPDQRAVARRRRRHARRRRRRVRSGRHHQLVELRLRRRRQGPDAQGLAAAVRLRAGQLRHLPRHHDAAWRGSRCRRCTAERSHGIAKSLDEATALRKKAEEQLKQFEAKIGGIDGEIETLLGAASARKPRRRRRASSPRPRPTPSASRSDAEHADRRRDRSRASRAAPRRHRGGRARRRGRR